MSYISNFRSHFCGSSNTKRKFTSPIFPLASLNYQLAAIKEWLSTMRNKCLCPQAAHLPSSLLSPSSWPFLSTPASSVPPFRSASGVLLTPSPVRASKLTRSLTQLTSQTLSSGSIVTGLASCLRREALFHRHRRHLCSCLRRHLSLSSAVILPCI
ncbi:hypothetical protein AAHE18_18G128300 [Arachis hypogaea]